MKRTYFAGKICFSVCFCSSCTGAHATRGRPWYQVRASRANLCTQPNRKVGERELSYYLQKLIPLVFPAIAFITK